MNSEYWVYYKRHEIILKYYLMMFPWPGFNTWFSPLVQFSSLTQSCPTLCDSMNCSMPGLTVHHQLPEFSQTHVHWVSDAIQPSNPLLSPSPPVFNLSRHQGLFKWVNSSHQVAKVLEFQLQHQSFQWKLRTDLHIDINRNQKETEQGKCRAGLLMFIGVL